MEKTNVMRILDQKKISYREYHVDTEAPLSAADLAQALHVDEKKVYKTLVTQAKSKKYYVFMLRADEQLDLKKAAKAANEKSIDMIPQKELLPLTGYVHGGCSPIGMKKSFPTFISDSVSEADTFLFSGGKIGYQVEMQLKDLQKVVRVQTADIAVKDE